MNFTTLEWRTVEDTSPLHTFHAVPRDLQGGVDGDKPGHCWEVRAGNIGQSPEQRPSCGSHPKAAAP